METSRKSNEANFAQFDFLAESIGVSLGLISVVDADERPPLHDSQTGSRTLFFD